MTLDFRSCLLAGLISAGSLFGASAVAGEDAGGAQWRVAQAPAVQDTEQERKRRKDERRDDRRELRDQRLDQKRDMGQERRDDRRELRDQRLDQKRDVGQERRDDRRELRDQRFDQKRDVGQERRDDRRELQVRQLEDVRRLRRERVEDGGRLRIVEEPDRRLIVREQGRMVIRHDDGDRFRRQFRDARSERQRDGSMMTTYVRPDGIHIVSVVDSHGRLLHRYRRHRDGRIVVLIDNRRYYRPGIGGIFLGGFIDLSPPIIRIPREKYIVEYETASYDDLYEALSAPPVDVLDRDYSLDEIRQSRYLRERMRRIDLDSINFAFGSWEVEPDQFHKLERIARAINRVLDRSPDEIFLIEGYTDAVGSEEDNLTLSDRRAEAVAMVLSDNFGVPPENLETQGYGEQFLKIDTLGPERLNRRVAVRRITPLLSRAER